jgi:rhomboid protease GluP
MHYDEFMGSYPSAPPPPDQIHARGYGHSPSPDQIASGSSGVVPEILPPGTGTIGPQPVRRRPAPSWLRSPATYILVGINCLVYLAMVANKVSPTNPTIEQLMHWGADRAGEVLIGGQWWRIITAMFVHVGFLHIALNMWCLWNLALLAEPLMGFVGVVGVYILTGAAGNLLSTFVSWWWYSGDWVKYHDFGVFPAGAGASGAVFGIAGALIVLLKSPRLPVPPYELRKLRKSVIYFAAINLILGFSISFGTRMIGSGISIDNMAHLGGFTCGLLFAAPMVPRLGAPRPLFQARLQMAIVVVVGVLVLFGVFLSHFAG